MDNQIVSFVITQRKP